MAIPSKEGLPVLLVAVQAIKLAHNIILASIYARM